MIHIDELYIREVNGKGKGIFCARPILKSEIIEVCPVIIIPHNQVEIIHRTVLHDYYFLWSHQRAAIALGYGSLYNHSAHANAEYIMDFEANQLFIQAVKDIPQDTEICFNYNGGPEEKGSLWFVEK
jgi:SET domain-containing protein